MAPLSPDNTVRWFLKYNVNNHIHTVTVRSDATVDPGTFAEEMGTFIEAIEPALYSTQFVALERSGVGSSVRVPVGWSGPMEWGTDSGNEKDAPQFISFTGKSVDGRRFRLEMFGRIGEANANFRVLEIDSTVVANALLALETTEPMFLTISNAGPIFNRYMNQSISQHWIGELRH